MRADSKLTEIVVATYKQLFGKQPVVRGIHAGLECGLFSGKLPGLDCVSVGPDLDEIHTFRERLHIASTARLWAMVVEVLRRMK
jgi:dipeptidase D